MGVTRNTQIPTRWIDQGAVKAIRLAVTPYRQAAGLIEVALKDHISDKTSWQKMLKGEIEEHDLIQLKTDMSAFVPDEFKQYLTQNDDLVEIHYPIIAHPPKVKSLKLDKEPLLEKKLMGIKGQYLLFDDATVINMRSHSGYKVRVEF